MKRTLGLTTMKGRDSNGFTIVELMIASALFALVLLITSLASVVIGKQYWRGIDSSTAQEVARNIVDQMSRQIQFSGGPIQENISNGGYDGFCIDNHRYTFSKKKRMTVSPYIPWYGQRHVIMQDDIANCGSPPDGLAQNLRAGSPGPKGADLLRQGVWLTDLSLTQDTTNPRLYHIYIKLLTGLDTDLNATLDGCATSLCNIAELRTVVEKRIP